MGTELSNNNLEVAKVAGTQYDPVFKQILSDIPGGVTLKSAEFPTDLIVLGAGTMVAESDTDGLYNLVKTAKSTSTQASDTIVEVVAQAKYKTLFKVGEFIAIYGAATASTITAIYHTNATQDNFIVIRALGALTTADYIVRLADSSTVVAATLAGQYTAKGFTRSVIKVREDDGTTLYNVGVGIVTRGEVNESKLPYVVDTGRKTDLTARFIYS